MGIREDFSSAYYEKYGFAPEDESLWSVRWMAKKCEEVCASPTSKGRIRAMMEEFDETIQGS